MSSSLPFRRCKEFRRISLACFWHGKVLQILPYPLNCLFTWSTQKPSFASVPCFYRLRHCPSLQEKARKAHGTPGACSRRLPSRSWRLSVRPVNYPMSAKGTSNDSWYCSMTVEASKAQLTRLGNSCSASVHVVWIEFLQLLQL